MDEYESAVKDFSAAMESGKQLFRAYFNRGNCYRKLGRIGEWGAACETRRHSTDQLPPLPFSFSDDAVKDLQEAVNVDSRPATGHNNLGLALCEAGSYEEALKAFDMAVDRQPENPTFLNNRALAQYHLGRLDEAIKVATATHNPLGGPA